MEPAHYFTNLFDCLLCVVSVPSRARPSPSLHQTAGALGSCSLPLLAAPQTRRPAWSTGTDRLTDRQLLWLVSPLGADWPAVSGGVPAPGASAVGRVHAALRLAPVCWTRCSQAPQPRTRARAVIRAQLKAQAVEVDGGTAAMAGDGQRRGGAQMRAVCLE